VKTCLSDNNPSDLSAGAGVTRPARAADATTRPLTREAACATASRTCRMLRSGAGCQRQRLPPRRGQVPLCLRVCRFARPGFHGLRNRGSPVEQTPPQAHGVLDGPLVSRRARRSSQPARDSPRCGRAGGDRAPSGTGCSRVCAAAPASGGDRVASASHRCR